MSDEGTEPLKFDSESFEMIPDDNLDDVMEDYIRDELQKSNEVLANFLATMWFIHKDIPLDEVKLVEERDWVGPKFKTSWRLERIDDDEGLHESDV